MQLSAQVPADDLTVIASSGRDVLQTLESDVAVLDADIAGLEAVIAHAGDLRYREQLARKQGYVYPHETLLIPRSP